MSIFSLNNRLVVEPYRKDRALRPANTGTGFALVSQKIEIVGLKVLIDAKLSDGTIIFKDSIAYIKEEYLHSAPWAQKSTKSEAVGGDCLVVDLNYVEFIDNKDQV